MNLSLRIFVNPGPGFIPTSRGVVFVVKYYSGYQSEKLLQAHHPRMRIPLFSISVTSKLQILPEDVRKGLNMKEIIK